MPQPTQHRVTIRLTPEESALLKAKAGSRPMATFLRELALAKAAAKRQASRPAPLKDHLALAQVLAKLGTSPLVQSFRDAVADLDKGTVPMSKAAEQSLAQIAVELASIRSLLMQALGVAER